MIQAVSCHSSCRLRWSTPRPARRAYTLNRAAERKTRRGGLRADQACCRHETGRSVGRRRGRAPAFQVPALRPGLCLADQIGRRDISADRPGRDWQDPKGRSRSKRKDPRPAAWRMGSGTIDPSRRSRNGERRWQERRRRKNTTQGAAKPSRSTAQRSDNVGPPSLHHRRKETFDPAVMRLQPPFGRRYEREGDVGRNVELLRLGEIGRQHAWVAP